MKKLYLGMSCFGFGFLPMALSKHLDLGIKDTILLYVGFGLLIGGLLGYLMSFYKEKIDK